jgi:hypothetical protein
MKTMNPLIPIFVASPSEVQEERQLAESAIQSIAHRFTRLYGVTLVPMLWEQFAPISSHDATHPQIGILRRIQPFSIFVGILWNKCGTPVGDSGETGTEMEFKHAIKNRSTISILTYFRQQTIHKRRSRKIQTQQEQVDDLKNKLQAQKITTMSYSNILEFSQRILPDIMEACLELILTKEPKKIADYYNFFKFGSHWRTSTRPLLIVYPPITDPGPGHQKPRLNWRKRLLPHVIYEDFKAIQDIEEAMRFLGRDYKTVTTDSPTLSMSEPGDRIWVCVPRNIKAHRALEQLERQGTKIRFDFQSISEPNEDPETYLMWNKGRRKREIRIRSPLSKYLSLSARPEGNEEWKPLYGYSYCRDYAVLARLKLYKDAEDRDGEFYYHYFIGGIRGLGTWGIGYLIDHNSSKLLRIADRQIDDESDNVQMLLEVTYENFRVTRVIDVSDEDKNFFEKRYSDKYIKDQLKRHPDWLPKTIC